MVSMPNNVHLSDLDFNCMTVAAREDPSRWGYRSFCHWDNGLIFFSEVSSDRKQVFQPRLIPAMFDPKAAVSWLNVCETTHGDACEARDIPAGMKVIDVKSRVVVDAPDGCVYTALSYVWGSDGAANSGDTPDWAADLQSPQLIPNTILDAITVTRRLNIPYLWVDRYCIDQESPERKAEQIRQMSSIYGGASLTIIAAAGKDASFGLPGVGSTLRRVQPVARIGGIQVWYGMTPVDDVIAKSKWSTRGWTCQEALLSRRCLVFTEDQVYFECRSMRRSEGIEVLPEHAQSVGDFDINRLVNRMYHSLVPSHWETESDANRYREIAMEYSKRHLGRDEDAFNAFAGIAARLTDSGVYQISGLSFEDEPGDPDRLHHSFAHSLLFYHHQYDKPRRRSMFPSWSWVGWAGRVYWPDFRGSPHIKVSFGLNSGELVTLDSLFREVKTLKILKTQPKYLNICGFVPVTNHVLRDKTKYWRWRWQIAGGKASIWTSEALENNIVAERFKNQCWELILMQTSGEKGYGVFLIVEHQEGAGRKKKG
ncbi:hypothetical protein CLAIMM_13213 isoform 1 [Cladophialophora immunda]|nr:hypothetical protein CLAIMM_13213 isoform 1 [Cladophialophora immunda]